MDRDCGEGKLIPHTYELRWCIEQSDREDVGGPNTHRFDQLAETLPPYSNVRLYVKDKQGYANCIKSCFVAADGSRSYGRDRTGEL